MACELYVGSTVGSVKISRWLTTRSPLADGSSQAGTWSSVTR